MAGPETIHRELAERVVMRHLKAREPGTPIEDVRREIINEIALNESDEIARQRMIEAATALLDGR